MLRRVAFWLLSPLLIHRVAVVAVVDNGTDCRIRLVEHDHDDSSEDDDDDDDTEESGGVEECERPLKG